MAQAQLVILMGGPPYLMLSLPVANHFKHIPSLNPLSQNPHFSLIQISPSTYNKLSYPPGSSWWRLLFFKARQIEQGGEEGCLYTNFYDTKVNKF